MRKLFTNLINYQRRSAFSTTVREIQLPNINGGDQETESAESKTTSTAAATAASSSSTTTTFVPPRKSRASPPTAPNVATPIDFMEDTMNDLHGTKGTHGIALWNRFHVLNEYMHGFRLGELTVLTGPTGSGKTTFLSEYSLDLAEAGVNTLWCNFELKNSRLCAMMVRQLYSTQSNPWDPRADSEATIKKKIRDMCVNIPIYFTTFTGATRVDRIIQTIQAQHDIEPLHHVIIDNLQFMLGTAGASGAASPFLIQDAVFAQFRRLATRENIHVTMVVHPRKFAQGDIDQELSVHSLYGGGKISQEADNIYLIQVKKSNMDFFNKYLQIAKNRFFGDIYLGDKMQLTFHKPSQRHSLTWKKQDETNYEQTGKSGYYKKD